MKRQSLHTSKTAFFSAVLGLFVHLAPAMADEVLDRARSLAKQNNPKGALELLLPLEGARAGDIEYDYLLGITALDAGDAQQAVFALERVLAVNPNYLQARAEIARAYAELGERENAKREFRNVLSANPPDAVKQTIDRVLSALIANGRRLSAYLEFGYGTDSNVNSATASSQVALPALGGGLTTLGPGGSRLGDNFSSVSAGVNLLQPMSEEWALVAGAAASVRMNNTDKQFDTNSLDGNIGARWSRDKNAVSAAFQAQTFSVDNTRFRDTTGIVAQWQHSYSDTRQITAYTQLSDLRYPTQTIRDARREVYGLSYAEGLGGPRNIVLFGSIYGGQEQETAQGVQHLGHKLVGARLGGQLDIGAKSQLFASLGGEQRHYGGQEPLFLTTRRDAQLDVRVGVNYTFMPTWMLTPQISYTDNQSNIATSKFSRNMASVVLRKDF